MTARDRIYRLALIEMIVAFVICMATLFGFVLTDSPVDDAPPPLELHVSFYGDGS